jgi:hypothetical protein
MPKPLRKPKLSRSTFAKTSFNWSRFFGQLYCFICACALIFLAPQEKINQQQVGIDQNNIAIELSVGEMLQIEHPATGNTKKGVE